MIQWANSWNCTANELLKRVSSKDITEYFVMNDLMQKLKEEEEIERESENLKFSLMNYRPKGE